MTNVEKAGPTFFVFVPSAVVILEPKARKSWRGVKWWHKFVKADSKQDSKAK